MYTVVMASEWRAGAQYRRPMYGTLEDAARSCQKLEKRDGQPRWIVMKSGHLEDWASVLRLGPGY